MLKNLTNWPKIMQIYLIPFLLILSFSVKGLTPSQNNHFRHLNNPVIISLREDIWTNGLTKGEKFHNVDNLEILELFKKNESESESEKIQITSNKKSYEVPVEINRPLNRLLYSDHFFFQLN
jgi:hypothetical protein